MQMILIKHLQNFNKSAVYDILKHTYEDIDNVNSGAYDIFLEEFLSTHYSHTNNKIAIYRYLDEDDGESYIHCSYIRADDLENKYAIDFTEWEDLLGAEVEIEEGISEEAAIADLLYEMTFSGFTKSEQTERKQALFESTKEINHQPYTRVTWQDLEDTVSELAEWVKEQQFNPDCILAVARGGTFLGTMLSYKLNIPIRYVGISSYDKSKKKDNIIFTQYAELNGYKKILVVDDIVDSGRTIDIIKNIIELNSDEREFKYATMCTVGAKKSSIDWFKYTKKDSDWVVFPWECDEVVR